MILRTGLVVLFALAVVALPSARKEEATATTTAAPVAAESATTSATAGSAEVEATVAETGFTCEGRIFGYYGDQTNCSLFHYCEPFMDPEGNQFVLHAAYLCPNDTVFNQLSLTCAYKEDALPCERAPEYYYINSHVVPAETDSSEASSEESTDAPGESEGTTNAPEGETPKQEEEKKDS